MPLSCFTRCGNGFRCSGAKPLGQIIFEAIAESHGGVYQDEEIAGPVAARWFAWAMSIARARYMLEKAKEQANPLCVADLLEAQERHHLLTPEPDATDKERRLELAAAMQLSAGGVRDNVTFQLQTALGDDFIKWHTVTPGPDHDFPENPWDTLVSPERNPVGIFALPARGWKLIRFLDRIDGLTTISEQADALQSPRWEHVAGDEGGLYTIQPEGEGGPAGRQLPDKFIVAPGLLGQQEVVAPYDRSGFAKETYFSGPFKRPHEAGTIAIRAPWPYWLSNQKHSFVVVKHGRARDRALRKKVSRILFKLLGSTSSWDIVEENPTTYYPAPEAAPTVATRNTDAQNTNATSFTIDVPGSGGLAAGDIVIIGITKDGAADFTGTFPPDGFLLGGNVANGVAARSAMIWRRCDGVTDPATVVVEGASENYISRGWHIEAADALSDPEFAAETGTSAAANPPERTFTWKTDLSLVLFYVGFDGNSSASAYPAGYSNTGDDTTSDATTTNRCAQAYGEKADVTAGSDDPGVLTNTNEQWIAFTVAIRGARTETAFEFAGSCGPFVPGVGEPGITPIQEIEL